MAAALEVLQPQSRNPIGDEEDGEPDPEFFDEPSKRLKTNYEAFMKRKTNNQEISQLATFLFQIAEMLDGVIILQRTSLVLNILFHCLRSYFLFRFTLIICLRDILFIDDILLSSTGYFGTFISRFNCFKRRGT